MPTNAANERRRRIAQGKRTYQGQPCAACGHTLRSVISDRCTECGSTKSAAPEQKRVCRWCGGKRFYEREQAVYCVRCSGEQIDVPLKLNPAIYGDD